MGMSRFHPASHLDALIQVDDISAQAPEETWRLT
jgi:hypothetical protein